MTESKECQAGRQPWECMGDAFKQIRNLFEPEKKEKKEVEAEHDTRNK